MYQLSIKIPRAWERIRLIDLSSEDIILVGGERDQMKTLFLLAITGIYFTQFDLQQRLSWLLVIIGFGSWIIIDITPLFEDN